MGSMRKQRRFRPRGGMFNGRRYFRGRDGQRYFYTDETRDFQYLGALASAPTELPPGWTEEIVDYQARFRNVATGEVREYRNSCEISRRVQLDGIYVAIEMKQKRQAEQPAAAVDQDNAGIEYSI
jgi:hypothetical protein